MQDQSSDPVAPPSRWPFFVLGFALFVLGPVIYFVQMSWSLTVPWYVPVLSTLGVIVLTLASRRSRVIVRIVVMLFFMLCALEWLFFVELTKTPPYAGPAQPGSKVPAFQAAYADGKPFTNRDLEDGQRTVMLFYRGRW